MTGAGRDRGWLWFVGWMLPGACFALGISAIGLFTLPVGVGLCFVLSARRAGVAMLGMLAGLGATVTWIGAVNLHYQACSSARGDSGGFFLAAGATRAVSSHCGGVDGLPWMLAGIALVVASLILYLRATRPSRRGPAPSALPQS